MSQPSRLSILIPSIPKTGRGHTLRDLGHVLQLLDRLPLLETFWSLSLAALAVLLLQGELGGSSGWTLPTTTAPNW